jgi:hypothetical protein
VDQTSGILSNMGGLHDNTSFLSPLQDIFRPDQEYMDMIKKKQNA